MEFYKILIVDDETDLREILSIHLASEGYQIATAESAEEALTLPLEQFHLLLLDVMMDGMSGFDLAQQLRQNPRMKQLPIIFLTARDTEDDLLEGFQQGADDYMTKPFSLRELSARIHAVLQRTAKKKPIAGATLVFKGLILDEQRRQLFVDGTEVDLTPIELQIMRLFLSQKDRIFSREEVLRAAWPEEVVVSGRTVDTNITRLRKKLGPYALHLITRTGHGYGFFNEPHT